MLGIIVGVGAVIAMVALGDGAKERVQAQIDRLGPNVLVIEPGHITENGLRIGSGARTLLGSDAQAIMEEVPVVAFASPSLRRIEHVVARNQNWATYVQGVAPEFQDIRAWNVEEGRFINDGDVDQGAKVAVIGRTVADKLFGNENPIDAVIRVRNVLFRVTGILSPKGQTGHGTDEDDVVLIPYTTMQKRMLRIPNVHSILVSAVSTDRLQEAQNLISALLRQRHRLQPDRDDDFVIRRLSAVAETEANNTQTMAILLGSIASISLLVGGVGIMNIMLVSVAERTREIGIRMAVGARSRDIMLQFLVEAVVIAVSGGAIGILLGIGSSIVLNHLAQWPAIIGPEIVALAFALSAAVGIFFGVYPAQKAAHLDPIEALRYE